MLTAWAIGLALFIGFNAYIVASTTEGSRSKKAGRFFAVVVGGAAALVVWLVFGLAIGVFDSLAALVIVAALLVLGARALLRVLLQRK